MERLSDPAAVRAWVDRTKAAGGRVAFVPTMGYLHDGHIELVRRARELCEHVVVSIFVNPLQFGPSEDLSRYPRDPEGDAARCEGAGVSLLWSPEGRHLYPEGFQTRVQTGALTKGLCGASRPGHFDGVATVVLKLFSVVEPEVACFGEKDWQQLRVIQRMVEDFHLRIRVVPCPTIREGDGLARSSRNSYLSPEERAAALALVRALDACERLFRAGERAPTTLLTTARSVVQAEALARIDYVELVDAMTLTPLTHELTEPALLALAVRFGSTRLIDNRVFR